MSNKKEKKKGGPLSKQEKLDINKQLKVIVETGQILGVTETQLAEKFGITRVTLRSYLKEIYNSIPVEDIKQVQVKIKTLFDKLFRESQKLVQEAVTSKEKREALEFLLRCIKDFTDFLERFGLKAKAIENIAVKGEIDHRLQYEVIVKGQDEESES